MIEAALLSVNTLLLVYLVWTSRSKSSSTDEIARETITLDTDSIGLTD